MNLHQRGVPSWFRSLCESEMPGLGERADLWRLLEYVLFHTRNKTDATLYLGEDVLAHLARQEKRQRGNHFQGGKMLADFQAAVAGAIRFRIVPHMDGRARTLRDMAFESRQLEQAVQTVLTTRCPREARVYMETGHPWSYRKHKAAVEIDKRLAVESLAAHHIPEASNLLRLLNDAPPNRFTSALDAHLDEALAHAPGLPDAAYYQKILCGLADRPQPIYHATANSIRLYGSGQTLQNLHRELRAILTQNWEECDLSACHLAICAYLWDVPPVVDFLRSRRSFWQMLADDYGVSLTEAFKDVVKPALYALMYGDNKGNVCKKLRRGGLDPVPFFANPVVNAMFEARNRMMARIHADLGAMDIFGRWIDTTEMVIEEQFVDDVWMEVKIEHVNVKSILAQLSQAVEFKILYPAVELAMEHHDVNGFQILLWQWDGFSMQANNRRNTEMWQRIITEAVNAQALALGVETRLLWKERRPATLTPPVADTEMEEPPRLVASSLLQTEGMDTLPRAA